MSDRYKIKDNEAAYFVTLTTVGWVDVFTRLNQKLALVNSLLARICNPCGYFIMQSSAKVANPFEREVEWNAVDLDWPDIHCVTLC